MTSGTLPKIVVFVCEHSSLCHPQMQVKALSCKRKPYMNMIQRQQHLLWASACLKQTVVTLTTVLWPDVKFLINFWKSWTVCPPDKRGEIPLPHPVAPMAWGGLFQSYFNFAAYFSLHYTQIIAFSSDLKVNHFKQSILSSAKLDIVVQNLLLVYIY